MRWNPDDLFGGYFDFNDDGVTDTGESWIAYNIMNDDTTFSSDSDDDDDDEYSTTRHHYSPRTSIYQSTGTYNQSSSYSSPQSSLSSVKKDDYAWKRRLGHVYLHGIYSDDYETEEEFWKAVDDERNSWRKYADDGSKYSLNPKNFKTEEEYNSAFVEKLLEDYEKLNARAIELDNKAQSIISDLEKIKQANASSGGYDAEAFSYCMVMIDDDSGAHNTYNYRCDGMNLDIGDRVIVPVGEDGEEKEGRVVSVSKCLNTYKACPAKETARVLRKLKSDE